MSDETNANQSSETLQLPCLAFEVDHRGIRYRVVICDHVVQKADGSPKVTIEIEWLSKDRTETPTWVASHAPTNADAAFLLLGHFKSGGTMTPAVSRAIDIAFDNHYRKGRS